MGSTYLRLNPAELIRVFQPNQQVVVIINQPAMDNGEIEQYSFSTQIIRIENHQLVLGFLPHSEVDLGLFRNGRVITIETGRSNGMFTFKSKIISKNISEGTLYLESPKILANTERRRKPRVPYTVPVIYRVISYRDQNLDHLSTKIGIGESQDLSEGGMTLLTDLKLPVGLILIVEFTLDNEDIALAGIVRRSAAAHRSHHQFAIGIKFLEPSSKYKELIMKTIEKYTKHFRHNITL
ncbi:MAG TPA: PilZ domain-containing protein [Bacillota bacterium]|nr:PilZ domain-containing protein [Bacillota bacterium]